MSKPKKTLKNHLYPEDSERIIINSYTVGDIKKKPVKKQENDNNDENSN